MARPKISKEELSRLREAEKNDYIRSKTWRYFWQQKWEELEIPLYIFGALIVLPFVVGSVLSLILGASLINPQSFFYFPLIVEHPVAGIYVLGAVTSVYLGLIIGAIWCFIGWIRDNWKEASNKARADWKWRKDGKE